MSTETVRIDPVTTRSRGRRRSRAESLSDALRFPVIVWVLHFVLTQIPASLAYHYGEIRSVHRVNGVWQPTNGQESGAYQIVRPKLDGWAHWIVEPFRSWDGTWYSMIAEQGYSTTYSALSAFFPLYPWLMDLGSHLTGLPVETVGYIISHVELLRADVGAQRYGPIGCGHWGIVPGIGNRGSCSPVRRVFVFDGP